MHLCVALGFFIADDGNEKHHSAVSIERLTLLSKMKFHIGKSFEKDRLSVRQPIG